MRSRNLILTTAATIILAVPVFWGLMMAPRLAAQAPAVQSSAVPQWQTDAGGPQAFDVASVKLNVADPSDVSPFSNVPLGDQDTFSPTGGLFSGTNILLWQYINFAYKLPPRQWEGVRATLPEWAKSIRYDIQARAGASAGKNQFRLMMQSLLKERFHLALHSETREVPVYELVLQKPGKPGPHLQPHAANVPCSSTPTPANLPLPRVAGGFPEFCGGAQVRGSSTPGLMNASGRNVTMAVIANLLGMQNLTGVDRPVFDQTGLAGTYDFVMEFVPADEAPAPGEDAPGPLFEPALRDQLGLKLESQRGMVDFIVIDYIEEPSPN